MSDKSLAFEHKGYEAALSGAAFYLYPHPGYLRISGEDRFDFLQRQTTNDIMSLQPGRVMKTVLTSPTARILDVFYLFMDEDENIGVITLPEYVGKTKEYLNKRIFFKDRVSISDLSHDYHQVDIEGPSAPEALLRFGIECPSEMNKLTEGDLDGRRLLVFSKWGLMQMGFKLMIREDQASSLINALSSAGVLRLTDEDFELLRVESGIPSAGKEITEEYTPLELNMEDAVSMHKGCYTGQEVIARQVNYDKVTRRLVGLRLDSVISVHSRVQVKDMEIGKVTSVAQSPRFGTIALAILKRPYYEPGTEVVIVDEIKQIRGYVDQMADRETSRS
jgi:folate-binding protein YgfZ